MASVDQIRSKLFDKIKELEDLKRLYGKAPRAGKFSVKNRKEIYYKLKKINREIKKLEQEKKIAEAPKKTTAIVPYKKTPLAKRRTDIIHVPKKPSRTLLGGGNNSGGARVGSRGNPERVTVTRVPETGGSGGTRPQPTQQPTPSVTTGGNIPGWLIGGLILAMIGFILGALI